MADHSDCVSAFSHLSNLQPFEALVFSLLGGERLVWTNPPGGGSWGRCVLV